jgi:pyruvate kinase
MRLTKIVSTLGPASTDPAILRTLIENGINIARVNFSHGTHEGHRETVNKVKKLSAELNIPMATLLDTKGPEIRSGDVETPVMVKKGEEVVFAHTDVDTGGRPLIKVNYPEFARDTKKAECIIVDNGTMLFDVVSATDEYVIAKSRDEGKISSRRHINLPGADISLPSMTEKDWADLDFGIAEKMDFLAPSFIRNAEEVKEIVAYLRKNNCNMKVISKIETRQSVDDIDNIIDASDGIMVARGDLGSEMPFEKIPAVQDMIVEKCLAKGKPVIVATHMLESMIKNPTPTRAEVTDVAYAAMIRTDATMLSGETAAGDHPLLAVQAMSTVLRETEARIAGKTLMKNRPFGAKSDLAAQAVEKAVSSKASAIVVLTRTGETARAVSAMRPNMPIVAVADNAEIQRGLLLCYGVFALNADADKAMDAIRSSHLKLSGKVIVVSDKGVEEASL